LPRIRQVVLAARELEPVADRLREKLCLGEPFSDPGVEYFGSLSAPRPPAAWRWGGPGWDRRAVRGLIEGVRIAVRDPDAVAERWRTVIGGLPGVDFVADEAEAGLAEIAVRVGDGARDPFELAGVRFVLTRSEEWVQ
jgi:hypothetical protein